MKRNKWGIVEAGKYSVVVDQEQPGFDDMESDDKISYSIATCYWSTHKEDAEAIARGLNLIRYSKDKLDENDSGVRVDSSIILGSIFCSLLLILVIVYLAFRYLIL